MDEDALRTRQGPTPGTWSHGYTIYRGAKGTAEARHELGQGKGKAWGEGMRHGTGDDKGVIHPNSAEIFLLAI